LDQFAVRARPPTRGIGLCHLFDQRLYLRTDRRTTAISVLRQLRPVKSETLAMPTNDRFGFDDDQRFSPSANCSIFIHSGTSKIPASIKSSGESKSGCQNHID